MKYLLQRNRISARFIYQQAEPKQTSADQLKITESVKMAVGKFPTEWLEEYYMYKMNEGKSEVKVPKDTDQIKREITAFLKKPENEQQREEFIAQVEIYEMRKKLAKDKPSDEQLDEIADWAEDFGLERTTLKKEAKIKPKEIEDDVVSIGEQPRDAVSTPEISKIPVITGRIGKPTIEELKLRTPENSRYITGSGVAIRTVSPSDPNVLVYTRALKDERADQVGVGGQDYERVTRSGGSILLVLKNGKPIEKDFQIIKKETGEDGKIKEKRYTVNFTKVQEGGGEYWIASEYLGNEEVVDTSDPEVQRVLDTMFPGNTYDAFLDMDDGSFEEIQAGEREAAHYVETNTKFINLVTTFKELQSRSMNGELIEGLIPSALRAIGQTIFGKGSKYGQGIDDAAYGQIAKDFNLSPNEFKTIYNEMIADYHQQVMGLIPTKNINSVGSRERSAQMSKGLRNISAKMGADTKFQKAAGEEFVASSQARLEYMARMMEEEAVMVEEETGRKVKRVTPEEIQYFTDAIFEKGGDIEQKIEHIAYSTNVPQSLGVTPKEFYETSVNNIEDIRANIGLFESVDGELAAAKNNPDKNAAINDIATNSVIQLYASQQEGGDDPARKAEIANYIATYLYNDGDRWDQAKRFFLQDIMGMALSALQGGITVFFHIRLKSVSDLVSVPDEHTVGVHYLGESGIGYHEKTTASLERLNDVYSRKLRTQSSLVDEEFEFDGVTPKEKAEKKEEFDNDLDKLFASNCKFLKLSQQQTNACLKGAAVSTDEIRRLILRGVEGMFFGSVRDRKEEVIQLYTRVFNARGIIARGGEAGQMAANQSHRDLKRIFSIYEDENADDVALDWKTGKRLYKALNPKKGEPKWSRTPTYYKNGSPAYYIIRTQRELGTDAFLGRRLKRFNGAKGGMRELSKLIMKTEDSVTALNVFQGMVEITREEDRKPLAAIIHGAISPHVGRRDEFFNLYPVEEALRPKLERYFNVMEGRMEGNLNAEMQTLADDPQFMEWAKLILAYIKSTKPGVDSAERDSAKEGMERYINRVTKVTVEPGARTIFESGEKTSDRAFTNPIHAKNGRDLHNYFATAYEVVGYTKHKDKSQRKPIYQVKPRWVGNDENGQKVFTQDPRVKYYVEDKEGKVIGPITDTEAINNGNENSPDVESEIAEFTRWVNTAILNAGYRDLDKGLFVPFKQDEILNAMTGAQLKMLTSRANGASQGGIPGLEKGLEIPEELLCFQVEKPLMGLTGKVETTSDGKKRMPRKKVGTIIYNLAVKPGCGNGQLLHSPICIKEKYRHMYADTVAKINDRLTLGITVHTFGGGTTTAPSEPTQPTTPTPTTPGPKPQPVVNPGPAVTPPTNINIPGPTALPKVPPRVPTNIIQGSTGGGTALPGNLFLGQ